jgi:PhnB protein
MSTPIKAIPDGQEGSIPYLSCHDAAGAIAFYERAFGADEVMRIGAPGGKIGHAEIAIGRARVMLADEHPEMGFRSPKTIGGSPVIIHIYVEDVDALVARASAAGATVTRPPTDEFYGDRIAQLTDPYGHSWSFATHKEDVSVEEMARRAAAKYGA